MVTVVNNPGGTDRVVEVDKGDSSAGWAVAVIVLLVVVGVGAYYWTHRAPAAEPQQPGTNIQVNLPPNTQPSGTQTQPAPTQ